jgi:hypothetical protein
MRTFLEKNAWSKQVLSLKLKFHFGLKFQKGRSDAPIVECDACGADT